MLVCFEFRTPRIDDLKSQSKVRSNKSEQTRKLNISGIWWDCIWESYIDLDESTVYIYSSWKYIKLQSMIDVVEKNMPHAAGCESHLAHFEVDVLPRLHTCRPISWFCPCESVSLCPCKPGNPQGTNDSEQGATNFVESCVLSKWLSTFKQKKSTTTLKLQKFSWYWSPAVIVNKFRRVGMDFTATDFFALVALTCLDLRKNVENSLYFLIFDATFSWTFPLDEISDDS